MALKLTTWGAAETVTGSNFLIEGARGKLLVDCGIEQGRDFSEADAYAPFPYDVAQIDALVITHAHLDHVGRAPKLVKDGFRGEVYLTPPTRDLMEAILRDSAGILADTAKKQGVDPLYTIADVEALLSRVRTLGYHEEKEVAPGLSVYLRDTGHILGSASVRVKDLSDGATLALTGDIGNSPSPLLHDAEPITDADVVLMESVYGDRANPEKANRVQILTETLAQAIARGGAILMPAFSLERTQLMLYELAHLFAAKALPQIPVFLDSPLAISVTDIYRKWGNEYFKDEVEDEMRGNRDLFTFPFLSLTQSREESEKIRNTPNPKLIIAGAGMSHGGRIGRHEAQYLPRNDTTLIIVGYQAPGSPGRMLLEGAKHVHLDGREVKVAAKVENLSGWSGHADRDGLLSFAQSCLPGARAFIIGLGEPASARFLAQRIHGFLGVNAVVPVKGQTFTITKEGLVG